MLTGGGGESPAPHHPPQVAEQVGDALPDAEEAAEDGAEGADQEGPFPECPELPAEAVGQPDDEGRPLAVGLDGAADHHHRHPEQGGHRVGDAEVETAACKVFGGAASLLADPVAVAEHGHGAADPAHQRDRPGQPVAGQVGNRRQCQPFQDRPERGFQQDGGDQHGEEHHGDEEAHHLLEQAVAADPHHRQTGQAEQGAVDDLAVGRVVGDRQDGVGGDAAGAHQRRGHHEAPGEEVGEEDVLSRPAEAAHRPFEQGLACRQLPASQPLVENELDECPGHDRPEDRQAEPGAGQGRGGEVAGADPGGRDQHTGADRGKQSFSGNRHLVSPNDCGRKRYGMAPGVTPKREVLSG